MGDTGAAPFVTDPTIIAQPPFVRRWAARRRPAPSGTHRIGASGHRACGDRCAIAYGCWAIVETARLRPAVLDLWPVADDVVANPGQRARLRALRQLKRQAHPTLPSNVLGGDLDDQPAEFVAGDRGVVRRDLRPSDDQVVVGCAADPQPAAAKWDRL